MFFSGKDLSMEVQKCLIPNCATVTWNILRQETIRYGMNKSMVVIEFDSGRKVFKILFWIHYLKEKMFIFFR